MRDSFSRNIDYMRVSITDRCNLRCKYCMPYDLPYLPHEEILSYEEILRVCACAGENGVRTIKVTGGEPLARLGCIDFIRRLKSLPGIENVTLTTNGVMLGEHLQALAEIGIGGINISLDTQKPDVYRELTGKDDFQKVWAALMRALELGLKVKLNCVPLRGVNDSELADFVKLLETYALDMRFIEVMPIGYGAGFEPIPGEEILAGLMKIYPGLREDSAKRGYGPARYYTDDSFKGGVGFIDAVSHGFCESCNRVRLTSEGFLKLCLYHEDGVDLKALLRGGMGDDVLSDAIGAAIAAKPEKHLFGTPKPSGSGRGMHRIGG